MTRRTPTSLWERHLTRRLSRGLTAGLTMRPLRPAAAPSTAGPGRRVAAVLAVLALCLSVSGCGIPGLYGVSLPGGADLGDDPYTVNVEFADVLDLVPQSAVKVDDVAVGRVEDIRLDGWKAVAVLRIRGDVVLPANAIALLRQTSLLGEKFVDLRPPPTFAPEGRLRSGMTIPLANSGRNVEVEELLSALSLVLNGGGLANLQTIAKELGIALQGRETAIKKTLTELNTFVGGLDAQKAQIVQAIDALDSLVGKLAAQKSVIDKGLAVIPLGIKVLNSQRPALVTMLQALGDLGTVATDVVSQTKEDIVSDLRHLGTVLSTLVKTGQDLPKALDLALTFPFPNSAEAAIKGDYANLNATFDLSAQSILGNTGLLGALENAGLLDLVTAQGAPAPTVSPVPAMPGLTAVNVQQHPSTLTAIPGVSFPFAGTTEGSGA